MSNMISLSMFTSIIIEAPNSPTPSILTEYTSTANPVAVFTGSLLTHVTPEYTVSATVQVPEYTGTAVKIGSSNGLSVGAKAGVGVGVVVGILVLAGLLWFAYSLGKRRSRLSEATPLDPPMYDGNVHEEGKQSKVTLCSVHSMEPIEKAFAADKALDIKNS